MPLYYALFQRVFIPGKSADSWARIESRFPETEQKCFKDEKSEFASLEIIEQIQIIFQFFWKKMLRSNEGVCAKSALTFGPLTRV